ncbi:MAG: class I SAM-dependent methyltransferase [Actinomycetota bacterium]|nr:class I SAM-dependent methyltransferase [Actinomycetota bacterium]MDA8208025.1 class I SAM-dependent methyltransferase [Actinomycetota bacterium]
MPEKQEDQVQVRLRDRLGRSFGAVARQYAEARPRYPDSLLATIVESGTDALELGAGTGLLTETLATHHPRMLVATDLDAQMLGELRETVPTVPVIVARAERLPFPDRHFDLVVVGQAAHWFDLEPAAEEIRRVLRPGGKLALLWNHRSLQVDWVAEFDRITRAHAVGGVGREIAEAITATGCFTHFSALQASFEHRVDLDGARSLVESFSHVSTLPPAIRAGVVEEAVEHLRPRADRQGIVSIPYYCEAYVAHATPNPA